MEIDFEKISKYTENDLIENYENFISFVKKVLPDNPRNKKLLDLYDKYSERIASAPASGKAHFHLAVTGGYLLHVLNVCRSATGIKKLYSSLGGTIDFTDEELYFSCLNHDLGKLGDDDGEYYLVQDSQWHREKQGSLFKNNGDIYNMSVTDRALFLLQQNGIECYKKEWLSIKCSDGIYDESNKYYFINNSEERSLKTNLPYIVHLADFTACRVENDSYKRYKFGSSDDVS